MTQINYDIQDIARLQGSFVDYSGNPVDPTEVIVWVQTPDENVTKYTYTSNQVKKSSVGNYYYDFTITMSGIHIYRFEGTGAVQAGGETNFTVNTSKIITG